MAAVVMLVAGCARTNEGRGGTGETHFLTACGPSGCGPDLSCIASVCSQPCDDDAACKGLSPDATCDAAGAGDDGAPFCDVRCGSDADCSALGAMHSCDDGRCRARAPAAEDAGAGEPSCPAGCVEILGYPEDAERGCVDRARPEVLGCNCQSGDAFSRCGRRTADDTLWVYTANEAVSGFASCTFDESERVTHACEFAECAIQPRSTCSFEATCTSRGCDNPEFDARGCRRPPCDTDAACAGDERCVRLDCVNNSSCTVVNAGPSESCICGGPDICTPGGACNPVSAVGPGGAWQSLELANVNPICAAGCPGDCPECSEVRTVDPSGALLIQPMGTAELRSAMLSVQDLTDLAVLVDGPLLRAGLRDGFDCEVRVGDAQVDLRLTLPSGTLEQSVGQCALGYTPDEHEIARLYQLLFAY